MGREGSEKPSVRAKPAFRGEISSSLGKAALAVATRRCRTSSVVLWKLLVSCSSCTCGRMAGVRMRPGLKEHMWWESLNST